MPKWSRLNKSIINNISRPILCRMRYYTNEQFDVNEDSMAKLPFSNKYFFITNLNMEIPFNLNMQNMQQATISVVGDDDSVQMETSLNLIE